MTNQSDQLTLVTFQDQILVRQETDPFTQLLGGPEALMSRPENINHRGNPTRDGKELTNTHSIDMWFISAGKVMHAPAGSTVPVNANSKPIGKASEITVLGPFTLPPRPAGAPLFDADDMTRRWVMFKGKRLALVPESCPIQESADGNKSWLMLPEDVTEKDGRIIPKKESEFYLAKMIRPYAVILYRQGGKIRSMAAPQPYGHAGLSYTGELLGNVSDITLDTIEPGPDYIPGVEPVIKPHRKPAAKRTTRSKRAVKAGTVKRTTRRSAQL